MKHAPISSGSRKRGRMGATLLPRLFLLVLLAGCTLFEPRDGDAPLAASDLDWRPPLSPDAVLHNLDEVLQSGDPLRYEEILADSGWAITFQHIGDRVALVDGLAADWQRQDELVWWQRFSDQFRQEAQRPSFELARRDSVQTPDSTSYLVDYWIEVPTRDVVLEYSGRLRLSLSRHQLRGDWGIHRWEDFGSDTSSSWTILKQFYLWQ